MKMSDPRIASYVTAMQPEGFVVVPLDSERDPTKTYTFRV
jgi:hypothetical protein